MCRRPDPITWKQIGTGYLILACIGVGTVVPVLNPRGPGIPDDPIRSLIPYAMFAALYAFWCLLRRPLRLAGAYLAPTHDGQLRLKRGSVGLLWLLSILLSILMTRVTQLVNPW